MRHVLGASRADLRRATVLSVKPRRLVPWFVLALTAAPIAVLVPTSSAHAQEAEEEEFTAYVEEVFLGKVIYPQEQGEVQLTGGYFNSDESRHDSTFLFEVEYGITDQFQIGGEIASQSLTGDEFQDLQQSSVEVYYNFYRNPDTGRAYGIGFEFGLPIDATDDDPRECVYEPFFVAYQDYRSYAVNFSGALEVADPVTGGASTEIAGELDLVVFGRVDRWAYLLETSVGIEADGTPVRLAPGCYWRPFDVAFDVGASLPIGLTSDAPHVGVVVLAILEFDAPLRSKR